MTQNDRVFLPNGTELTRDITVTSPLNDFGGSCLTYFGEDDSGATVIIKELYPQITPFPLKREGVRIVPADDVDEKRAARFSAKLKSDAEKQEKYAKDLYKTPDGNNTIYSFALSDITDKVTENGDFEGTLARYIKIETKSGKTLGRIFDEGGEHFSDEKRVYHAFLRTQKILETLDRIHSRELLHLDVKPDNIYFVTEPDLEKQYCIFLDYGSAIVDSKKDEKNSEKTFLSLSYSDDYVACEVKQAAELVRYNYNDSAEKYASAIGYRSDLFSVGIILLELLSKKRAQETEIAISGSKEEKFERSIYAAVNDALPAKYSYLTNRIVKILRRALYVPHANLSLDDWIASLEENRYNSCGEFLKDVDTVLEIIDKKGVHPEIILEKSRENFAKYIEDFAKLPKKTGVEDPINDDDLFIRDWFAPVTDK